jgi:hypothetical protein
VADPEGLLPPLLYFALIMVDHTLRVETAFDVVKEVTGSSSFTCDITEKLFCKNKFR